MFVEVKMLQHFFKYLWKNNFKVNQRKIIKDFPIHLVGVDLHITSNKRIHYENKSSRSNVDLN